MTTDLSRKTCRACRGEEDRLEGEELTVYASHIPDWQIAAGPRLRRRFSFGNFADALAFVNRVGQEAEQQHHHPVIRFGWGFAEISLHTHKIGGLTQSDFVLAARVDRLAQA
jgi:4a-hydroxytetrahydrobiopterin dehydratase